MGDMPRGHSNFAVVRESFFLECFDEIGQLETVNGRRRWSPDLLQRRHDPQRCAGLESLQRTVEDCA